MRRVHDLASAQLEDLPPGCRACVFWEVADGQRGPTEDGGRERKAAWWQATQLEWGAPGKGVYVDGVLAAYMTFAPPRHFPRVRQFAASPSDDALLLAALWVAPAHRGAGFGRLLIQTVVREASRHGARAVECFASRAEPALPCLVPERFLEANGFTLLHDDAHRPLFRLELRQVVKWPAMGQALEGVLAALGRRERAAPARPALEATRHRTN